jgi:primosomal protein N' (replication factor Y)
MYAQVALNAPLETAFDYAIPESLWGALAVGHLVKVPFRTAHEYGIVLSIHDNEPQYPLKAIVSRLDSQPVVTEREIALAHWMSAFYLAPLGMCLWLWLPRGLTSHSDILIDLIQSDGAQDDLEREIIALLKRRGSLRGRQLDMALAGKDWKVAVDGMAKAGILKKDSVLAAPRVRPRVVETAALSVHPRHIEQAVDVLARPSKPADLLEYVSEQESPVPVKEALKAVSATKTHVDKLVEQGVVTLNDDHLQLTSWREDLPALLAEFRKTDKALRVLRVLARQNTAMDISWLFAQTGATLPELRRMEEAELVYLGEKRQWRDSLADQHFLPTTPPPLTGAQAVVWETLEQIIPTQNSHTFLLHGVTGSGKTEIYLRAIAKALEMGKSAIFLVPEIALTPQTVRRVAGRFPGEVAIVHSGLRETERFDTWRRAREGLVHVIVGARSAIFTPLQNIGVIILDEEHDQSYKHSPPAHPPFYHTRQMAEEIVRQNGGIVILGSATPDIETYHRAKAGEITLLELPNRIMGHRVRIQEQAEEQGVLSRYHPAEDDALTIDLPPVQIVDMRSELKDGNTSIFSHSLHDAIYDTLKRKEQAILFLNRRGQSTHVFCRDCGHVVKCPRCETPLTYHRHGQALRCHRCDHSEPEPMICPKCMSRRIKFFGAGTQQVEQAVIESFPRAKTLRWDADTAPTHDAHDMILQRFMLRQADILIGTQMVAKGLDLPMVTLVGVVSADTGLNMPDFRASERAFQTLTQVAGRAGRGLLGGQVILQTYQPEHYAIQAAGRHDYTAFFQREIAYRRQLGYPPFRRLIRILFRFPSETKVKTEAERAAAIIQRTLKSRGMTGTEMIGPVPCFFTKEDTMYRWQILLRGPDPLPAVAGMDIPSGWHVDVDPAEVL